MSVVSRIRGHLWTLGPAVRWMIQPPQPSTQHRWSATLEDERGRPIEITGELMEVDTGAHEDTLVVMIHGLGGSAHSHYLVDAAMQCAERGWSSLRISLRGVDSSTQDIYHAGLTHDLRALLAHDSLARWKHLFLVGYSLGGHMVTRYATEQDRDPRVRGVCALCAPLDLSNVIHHIDSPRAWLYREYVLGALREHHARMVAHGQGVAPHFKVKRVKKLREFDALVIAPRYGFASPEAYYQEVGVQSRIEQIALPLLYVGSVADPMIPSEMGRRVLARAPSDLVDIRWLDDGGHVYFPPGRDLGLGDDLGVIPQVLQWFARTCPAA